LIDELKKKRAFVDLHRRTIPPDKLDWLGALLPPKHPASALTPYMLYALANTLTHQRALQPDDKRLTDRILTYYQLAAQSDSAYQMDIYMDLLSFVDTLELTDACVEIARQALRAAPRDMIGKIGDDPLIQRYLLNTKELNPDLSWSLMN
jgi:hypothetical protein